MDENLRVIEKNSNTECWQSKVTKRKNEREMERMGSARGKFSNVKF